MKISGDYDLCNADLGSGDHTVRGRVWKVRKANRGTEKSKAVASTSVNGVGVRLEISDRFRMGDFYIGRVYVASAILNSDKIADSGVRDLVEGGYLAMRAAMAAVETKKAAKRQRDIEKEQAAQTRRETKQAAAIARLSK